MCSRENVKSTKINKTPSPPPPREKIHIYLYRHFIQKAAVSVIDIGKRNHHMRLDLQVNTYSSMGRIRLKLVVLCVLHHAL